VLSASCKYQIVAVAAMGVAVLVVAAVVLTAAILLLLVVVLDNFPINNYLIKLTL